MSINKDLVYTIKDASEILDVHPRKLNRIAVKHNLEKVDNRYLFPGAFLIEYFNLTNVETSQNLSKDVSKDVKQYEAQIKEYEAIISDLREELKQYEVSSNERIEVFTHDEYLLLEQRLKEWATLQKDIEHQEQIFDIEKKTLSELLEHYKSQYDYQKKQSERILDMHQHLIDTIDKQNKLAIQRNIIEATEKEVIKKDTWKQ